MSAALSIYLALGCFFVSLTLIDIKLLRAGYLWHHQQTPYTGLGLVVVMILGVCLWPVALTIVAVRVVRRLRQGP